MGKLSELRELGKVLGEVVELVGLVGVVDVVKDSGAACGVDVVAAGFNSFCIPCAISAVSVVPFWVGCCGCSFESATACMSLADFNVSIAKNQTRQGVNTTLLNCAC